MQGPDFIVVGAPKCGTTTLHTYLSTVPGVHVAPKEPHYFGRDLTFAGRGMSRANYEALYPESGDRVRGDVSVWYLFSKLAASEIFEFNPDAKIIIMLRNPVDQMFSMHSQALFTRVETESSFELALELESARKRGEMLPRTSKTPHAVLYREIARFSQQIRRYLEFFDRERIHVILLEDLASDPARVGRELLGFLGVTVDTDPVISPVNTNKKVRSLALANLAAYVPRVMAPKLGLRRLPDGVKHKMLEVHHSFVSWNRSYVDRLPMDAVLRDRLLLEFQPEVDALETLLGLDLSAWHE